MIKSQKPKKFFYKKEFLYLAIPIIVLMVIIALNWEYVYKWLLNDVFRGLESLIRWFVEPLQQGDYVKFTLYLVLVLLGLLLIRQLYIGIAYTVRLWWKRDIMKPPNTYQYGDLHWLNWEEKKKYLNRCRFDDINGVGVGMDVKDEITITILGKTFLIKESAVFKPNKEISQSVSAREKQDRQNIIKGEI